MMGMQFHRNLNGIGNFANFLALLHYGVCGSLAHDLLVKTHKKRKTEKSQDFPSYF